MWFVATRSVPPSLGDADLLNLLAQLRRVSQPVERQWIAQDVGLGNHHAVNDRINDLGFAYPDLAKCHRIDQARRAQHAPEAQGVLRGPSDRAIPSVRHAAYRAPDVTKLSEQQLGLALVLAAADGRADAFVAADEVMYGEPRAPRRSTSSARARCRSRVSTSNATGGAKRVRSRPLWARSCCHAQFPRHRRRDRRARGDRRLAARHLNGR